MASGFSRARPAPQPKVQVLVRLDPSLKERVTRLASRRCCFETRVIEEALRAYLDAQEARP